MPNLASSGTAVVISLADARAKRNIRRSIALAAASGSIMAIRERLVRAAAFAFACDGLLERHVALALYDETCPADKHERDPATVARIVLGLPRGAEVTPSDLLLALGVESPSPFDAAHFMVETAADMYCRMHGMQCDN